MNDLKGKAAPATGTALNPRKHGKSSENGASRQSVTTLGWSLFEDGIYGSRTISDIRNQLEIKYAACLAIGGNNGHPLSIDVIQNPFLRQFAACGAVCKNWSLKDLTEVEDKLQIPAEEVLLATLERPVWGVDDVYLYNTLTYIGGLQNKAKRGGRSL